MLSPQSFLLRCVQKLLAARGFEIRKKGPLDLRHSPGSPRDLVLSRARRLDRPLLVDVPLARCRNGIGMRFDEYHYIVETLKDGPPATYRQSYLRAYFEHCQPENALAALGLNEEDAPGLAGLPATAYVVPWVVTSPQALRAKRAQWMKREAEACGKNLSLEDGFNHFGPVSEAKGELEIERLASLYRSLKSRGYERRNRGYSDIAGWLLTERGEHWCFQIKSGAHRAAVAAAVGVPALPVRTASIVLREAVEYWPQVVAGRYTVEGALKLFDRIMMGEAPPACHFTADKQRTAEAG